MPEKKIWSLAQRPRRNRKNNTLRLLLSETQLSVNDLVMPLFVVEGKKQAVGIPSMPGIEKLSVDLLVKEAHSLFDLGIKAVALFPCIEENLKNVKATESKNAKGLLQTAIRELKKNLPEMLVISDVAMDPYSTDGHDGLVKDGKVLNDETLPILGDMALAQACAGSDLVAPSDMMDGRVKYIREVLDRNGFEDVGILSYAVKYASSFYGPFRDALGSAPKKGDKKSYQMNPANIREALREVKLDVSEGADIVMVKPALSYLDVINEVKRTVDIPVAAYNVSGEYAMIKAAEQKGWLEEKSASMETLLSIKRAGADLIFSYFAKEAAQYLKDL